MSRFHDSAEIAMACPTCWPEARKIRSDIVERETAERLRRAADVRNAGEIVRLHEESERKLAEWSYGGAGRGRR